MRDRVDPNGLDPSARRRLVARSVLFTSAIGVLLTTAYYSVPWQSDEDSSRLALRLAIAIGVIFIGVVLSLRLVSVATLPIVRAIEVLAVLVTLELVVFAVTYMVVSAADADAFSEPLGHTASLYFSLTTATTIGYGDISARSDAARIVVMIHMVVNVLVIGVAARMLIATARRSVEGR